MKTPSAELINQLERQTKNFIHQAEDLLAVSEGALQQRPCNDGWNALECLEHLNRYGYFYLPEIRNRVNQSPHKATPVFKHGFWGDFFVKSMEPKVGLKKIKTFKDKNPIHAKLNKGCIHTFISQQKELLELLNSARQVDLNRTKTSISITKLLKLKLGDTFRFLITHNKRHLVQALAAMANNNNMVREQSSKVYSSSG